MKIGIAGPISLDVLIDFLPASAELPRGYPCPITALYARALLDKGHEVVIYTLSGGIQAPLWIEGDRLSILVMPGRPRRWWLNLMKQEIAALAQGMREHPSEVIHAHWPYEFAKAALDSGFPVLVTAHDAPLTVIRIMFGTMGIFLRLARLIVAIGVMRRAKCLTAVAPHVADEIRRWLRPRARFTVIPNGIPTELFTEFLPPRTYPGVTFMAILSGGFFGIKNGPGLIRAFAWAHGKMAGTRLVIYGGECGPGEAGEAWVRKSHPDLPIEFRGQVPHSELMTALRQECDVLLHPSLTESFGMAILEAMAHCLPVVGGMRSGGVPWLLEDGQSGILVDITSPEAFGTAIVELYANPVLRRDMGLRGYQRAKTGFSLETMTQSYLDLIEGLRNGVNIHAPDLSLESGPC